jgi:pentatricopeptide repeat protein
MPPNSLRSKSGYICQSCLSGITAKPTAVPPSRRFLSSWFSEISPAAASKPPTRQPRGNPLGKPLPLQEDEKLDVKYYDEVKPGRYRRLNNAEEFSDALSGLDPEAEKMIDDLESKLQDTAQMIKLLDKYGMKDKAKELRKMYELEGGETEKEKDRPALRIPEDGWRTPYQRKHVAQLNSFLRSARHIDPDNVEPNDVKRTWKHYSAARRALSASWERVPSEVWAFLWRVLSWEGEGNPNRMSHIYMLAKDLSSAGVPLTGPQQLLSIEAMFLEGYQTEAIDLWKKSVGTLAANTQSPTYQEYWELGVRMCSLHGDVERAERAANALLAAKPETDPRILLPLIRACAQREATVEKAWGHYHKLRELLGESMQIEDYDEVIGSFLSTNHTEYGLQSFVDMMFSSPVDVRGKTKLPSSIGNQFFLGKWLKRLIGAGDLSGAYSVLQYMQNKGIMGSAIQFNGLIGAWLRSSTAEGIEKAEELGWAMIHSRLLFVELRRKEETSEWPVKLKLSQTNENTALKFVPKATLETFSLLAENYRTRGLHEQLERLWEAFSEAEISTDAFMMNQMIESYVNKGKFQTAFEFYHSMIQQHGILPNAHTFLTLYNSLSINKTIVKSEDLVQQDEILARQFFKDLVEYPWVFDSEWLHDSLPRLILHSFSKLRDWAAMLAATRAMKELFFFAPSEALLLELAAGSKALRNPSKRSMELMINSSKKIELLLHQRHKELQAEGRSLENLTPEEKAQELGLILEKLIFFKATVTEEQMWPMYEQAAEDMGVYDIVIRRDQDLIERLSKVPEHLAPSS